MVMTTLLKPRVQAFLEDVREDEDPDVVQEFMKLFNASSDPNETNLFVMLEKARQSGPGAKVRAVRKQAERNLARQYCNS
jgi:hypothetical protein